MNYKEYVKLQMNEAKKKDYFDADGNSSTAVSNRSFLREMRLDARRLAGLFFDIDVREFLTHFASIAALVFMPFLFMPLLVSRAYFSRKGAEKEMRHYYDRDKKRSEKDA